MTDKLWPFYIGNDIRSVLNDELDDSQTDIEGRLKKVSGRTMGNKGHTYFEHQTDSIEVLQDGGGSVGVATIARDVFAVGCYANVDLWQRFR